MKIVTDGESRYHYTRYKGREVYVHIAYDIDYIFETFVSFMYKYSRDGMLTISTQLATKYLRNELRLRYPSIIVEFKLSARIQDTLFIDCHNDYAQDITDVTDKVCDVLRGVTV